MGIGGGIITRKFLLAVLLVATLSFGGIATVSAEEIETAQTQVDDVNSVDEKVNTKNDTSNLNESAKTQKSADKKIKNSKKYDKKHISMEHSNLKTYKKYDAQKKHVDTKKNQLKHHKPDNIDKKQSKTQKKTVKNEAVVTNDETNSVSSIITETTSTTESINTKDTQNQLTDDVKVTENNQNTTETSPDSDDSINKKPIQTTEQTNETDDLNSKIVETEQTTNAGTQSPESSNHENEYASGETTVATREQVKTAAVNVQNFINKNGRAPRTVNVGGTIVDYAVFARMAAAELNQLQGSGNLSLEFKPVARAVKSQSTLKNGSFNLAQYMDVTKRVLNYMNTNGRMPNYVTTVFGRMSPEQYLDMACRILGFYNQNNRLPNSVTIGRTVGAATTSATSASGGTKQPIPSDLQAYLKATGNCQVTNSQIQNLAQQITGGSNDINAATRLFNWVRDNVSYSFYYNTQRGAVKTMNDRKGNCVDQAHLLVALSRAAGIPARYVHGTCKFTSGNTYGHVWAEVWVNGKWYTVDPTSVRNKFGVINNWSLTTLKGRYTSLPF